MNKESVFQSGKVALVTGASSGIGRSACQIFIERGMSVCMVDSNSETLSRTTKDLSEGISERQTRLLTVTADVADIHQMNKIKSELMDRFGKLDILMNNAVSRSGRGLDAELDEWHQAMNVNFWGVVHGVRCFLPVMQLSEGRGVIVNVGSKQGITNPPGHPIYNITKSALKSYTETLEHYLRSKTKCKGWRQLSAHLLIPGWTTTGNNTHKQGAWLPDQVANFMIDGIERGDFYILCPDDETTTETDHKRILWAAEDITENRAALSRWHPSYMEQAKSRGI